MCPEEEAELDTVVGRAYALLHQFGIAAAPVDVEDMAQEMGIVVIRTHIDTPGCSGMLAKPAGGPILFLREQDCETRQRFTIAHEMWHALHGNDPMHLSWEMCGESVPWEERKADRFAAELLMPGNWVQEYVEARFPFSAICGVLRVSAESLRRRYHELGLRPYQTLNEMYGA